MCSTCRCPTSSATNIRRLRSSFTFTCGSYATIALETGLSRVTAQRAIALLERRQLVGATRSSRTAVPKYLVLKPWAGRKRSASAAAPGEIPFMHMRLVTSCCSLVLAYLT